MTDHVRCDCKLNPDWGEALELARNWSGYWEDDPIVHLDTARVGFLARSFVFAMAHFGVISKPRLVRFETNASGQEGDDKLVQADTLDLGLGDKGGVK